MYTSPLPLLQTLGERGKVYKLAAGENEVARIRYILYYYTYTRVMHKYFFRYYNFPFFTNSRAARVYNTVLCVYTVAFAERTPARAV